MEEIKQENIFMPQAFQHENQPNPFHNFKTL